MGATEFINSSRPWYLKAWRKFPADIDYEASAVSFLFCSIARDGAALPNGASMSPVIKFSLLCIAAIIGVSLIFWALAGFSSFGLDSDDFEFLALGSVFTCLLGIGLMAAMFYNDP